MCSCITQLIECLNDWTDSFDNKLGTDAIYLDFAKAFDTVPHNRLKLKLRNAGIRGNVLGWIVSFLNNRRQKVVLPGGSSSWMNVTSGVPQGSILGPILFLLYVNDLPDCVNSTAKLFADDTKLYREIIDPDDCHQIFLQNGNTARFSLYTESRNIFFKKIFSPFIKKHILFFEIARG
jgi:hypothetical protein